MEGHVKPCGTGKHAGFPPPSAPPGPCAAAHLHCGRGAQQPRDDGRTEAPGTQRLRAELRAAGRGAGGGWHGGGGRRGADQGPLRIDTATGIAAEPRSRVAFLVLKLCGALLWQHRRQFHASPNAPASGLHPTASL